MIFKHVILSILALTAHLDIGHAQGETGSNDEESCSVTGTILPTSMDIQQANTPRKTFCLE